MPASEAPDGDPALSPEVRTVVDRWNPQGGTLLRTAPQAADAPEPRGVADAGPVTLIAPDDPTTALLRTELARFEPRVVLTDPIGDPATLLDTPAPLPEVALVLLDPGSAVGAALVGPLTRLRLGGTRLLFALNGVHAHPDWRSVLHRDSLMLGQALGAEPEVVAVSARLAVAARAKSDAALTDRSGLPALHVALVAATEPVTEGDRSAGLTERVLIDTRSRVVNQIESLRSGTAVARLRSERTAALAGRDGGRAQALATLRNRIQLARVDLLHEVGVRVRTLNTAARADLDRLTRRTARDYPEHLQISVDRTTA
ncbi:MAG: hypothetical protein J2P18_20315, partial [Nocardia sp.]|nr:hypothetical protein [Nocardia sp.]